MRKETEMPSLNEPGTTLTRYIRTAEEAAKSEGYSFEGHGEGYLTLLSSLVAAQSQLCVASDLHNREVLNSAAIAELIRDQQRLHFLNEKDKAEDD
jgi:hypothetical protein